MTTTKEKFDSTSVAYYLEFKNLEKNFKFKVTYKMDLSNLNSCKEKNCTPERFLR